MRSLRDVQMAVSAAVRSGSADHAAMLLREDGIEPALRLQIYRNNHQLGSRATLQAAYPVIERLGGAEWFRDAASRYIARHPSTSGDLQNLGEHFPAFLRAELDGTPYGYFADVAALEWAFQCVLTAAGQPAFDLQGLRTFPPDDYEHLVFVPRAALRLVESRHPILAIWRANQPEEDDARAALRLDGAAVRVLVIRRADHVELQELSEAGACLLREFLLGRPLGAAAAAASLVMAGFDLEATLAQLVSLGTIGEVHLKPTAEASNPIRRIP